MRRFALLLLVPFFAACTEAPQAPEEPRVPIARTTETQLPPALAGNGGELQGMDLGYMEGDSLTTGYLAVPEGEGPFPALVLIHEWNGLSDRVRQVADDFAAEGYVTLAADLYGGRLGTNPDENMALVREANANMDGVVANLNAAVRYLKNRGDVTGRVERWAGASAAGLP